MARPHSPSVALPLILVAGFIAGVLGVLLPQRFFQETKTQQAVNTITIVPKKQPVCPKYSFEMSKDQYLRKYIVKPGDSLLKIAVNELSDKNRINEIVYLNLSKFPVTVSPSPLLEVGWILYLPPEWLRSSSGYLKGLQGQVIAVNDSNIVLTFDQETNRMYGDKYYLHYDKSITYIPKAGECVTVVMDTTNLGGRDPGILKISPQISSSE